MAKYKYKLQSLLNIKLKLEDQKKNELGKAILIYEQSVHELNMLNDNYKSLNFEQRKIIKNKIDTLGQNIYSNYATRLKIEIQKQDKLVKDNKDKVEKIRIELTQKSKERKILEKLKEKDYSNYISNLKKLEQKDIDEILSYKYNNRDI